MLFTTRLFLKQLLRSPMTPTHLGRWEHRQTDKHLDFKQMWANTDHCGDIICGNPETIKKNMVDSVLTDENKKKKVDGV